MQTTLQRRRKSYYRQHPDFQPDMLARLAEIDKAIEVISKLRAEYESVLKCFEKKGPNQEDLLSALMGIRQIEALGRPIHDLGMMNDQLMLTLEHILQDEIGPFVPVEEDFWETIPEYVEPIFIFPGSDEDPFDEDE